MKKLLTYLFVFLTLSLNGQKITPGIISSSQSSVSASSLLTGIVSNWKFDETSGTNAVDATGTQNLTSVNVTVNQTGKVGKCYSFNGTSSYAGNIDATYEFTDIISVSAWINTSSTGAYRCIMSNYNSTTTEEGYDLTITDGGKVEFAVRNVTNSTDGVITGGTTVTTGAWVHVVGTFDGTSIKLYINGTSDATAVTWSRAMGYNSSNRFQIGVREANLYFSGLIDNPEIWHKGLSSSEVTELYTKENAGTVYTW